MILAVVIAAAALAAPPAADAPSAPRQAEGERVESPAPLESGPQLESLSAAAAPEPPSAGTVYTLQQDLSLDAAGASNRDRIDFPFMARGDRALVGASVEIGFGSPVPAMPRITELEVLVNGEHVESIGPEVVNHSGERADVRIPPEFMSHRNVLSLRMKTDPEARCGTLKPGVWRFLRNVRLVLRTSPVPLPSDLSLLPLPFVDVSADRQATVPIVLPASPSKDHVRAAAIVASWFGVQSGVPLAFPVSSALPASDAVVLIAGKDEAAQLGMPPPTGPEIAFVNHPDQRRIAKLLVISGRDLKELTRTVEALGSGMLRLRGVRMTVEPVDLPAAMPYENPRSLLGTRAVRLVDFPNVGPLVYEGVRSGVISVRFRFAPDLFIWPRLEVPLDLAYELQYAAGYPPPRIVAELNGKFLAKLQVPPAAGRNMTSRTRISIPRYLLQGWNELRFDVQLGEWASYCDEDLERPVRMAILPESTLHLEGGGHFATLPNLALFLYDGYPFTRLADLSETALVMRKSPSPLEIGSALSAIASLATVTGRGATGLMVMPWEEVASLDRLERDLLIVGHTQGNLMMQRMADELPMRMVHGTPKLHVPRIGSPLGFVAYLEHYFERQRAETVLEQNRPTTAALQIHSPLARNRTAVFITASTAASMPATFDSLQGFAEAHSTEPDLLVSTGKQRWLFRIGSGFGVGEVSVLTRVSWYFAQNWMLLLPTVLLGVAFVAVPFRNFVERRTRARLQQ